MTRVRNSRRTLSALLLGLSGLAGGCATVPTLPDDGEAEEGIASFYSDALEGRSTASGEPYDPAAPSCAHRSRRFGTWLLVTVVDSGRSARCRVNDRGPFVSGRVVDVSRSVAAQLGLVERGLARVRLVPAP